MKTAANTRSKPAAPRSAVTPAGSRKTARLFTNGASQAVRLPKEFRMEGVEVRIWREGARVVLEPMAPPKQTLADVIERFYLACPEGLKIERSQPPMQVRDWSGFNAIAEPAPVGDRSRRRSRQK